jgi:hypothetical protein
MPDKSLSIFRKNKAKHDLNLTIGFYLWFDDLLVYYNKKMKNRKFIPLFQEKYWNWKKIIQIAKINRIFAFFKAVTNFQLYMYLLFKLR